MAAERPHGYVGATGKITYWSVTALFVLEQCCEENVELNFDLRRPSAEGEVKGGEDYATRVLQTKFHCLGLCGYVVELSVKVSCCAQYYCV